MPVRVVRTLFCCRAVGYTINYWPITRKLSGIHACNTHATTMIMMGSHNRFNPRCISPSSERLSTVTTPSAEIVSLWFFFRVCGVKRVSEFRPKKHTHTHQRHTVERTGQHEKKKNNTHTLEGCQQFFCMFLFVFVCYPVGCVFFFSCACWCCLLVRRVTPFFRSIRALY